MTRATIANMAMISGGSKQRFNAKDFLLEFTKDAKKQTVKEEQPNWQRMKLTAQMQYALSKAEEQQKAKRKEKQEDGVRRRNAGRTG